MLYQSDTSLLINDKIQLKTDNALVRHLHQKSTAIAHQN